MGSGELKMRLFSVLLLLAGCSTQALKPIIVNEKQITHCFKLDQTDYFVMHPLTKCPDLTPIQGVTNQVKRSARKSVTTSGGVKFTGLPALFFPKRVIFVAHRSDPSNVHSAGHYDRFDDTAFVAIKAPGLYRNTVHHMWHAVMIKSNWDNDGDDCHLSKTWRYVDPLFEDTRFKCASRISL